MENAVDVTEVTKPEVIDTTAAQKAYERVTNPDKPDEPVVEKPAKVEVEEVEEEAVVQATETPPENNEIAELRKRLDDVNGRYGRLSQKLEDTLSKLATPAKTQSAANEKAVDVEDMLAEVKEAFGEDDLYKSLKSAFSKALSNNRGVDPEAIEKIVADRIAQADKAREESAATVLSELHSDYKDVLFAKDDQGNILTGKDGIPIGKPEYFEWQKTLSPTAVRRLKTSTDPYFAAEMLDQFKAWDKTRKEAEKAEVNKPDPQKNKERLNKAVLPTSGTKAPAKMEPSAKEIAQAAYERVAGKRL